jgi:LmbE family N-acetylglucosaminyl deacetylase
MSTNQNRKILCVAVHPDDETLGCGGTLLRHREEGDSVECLFITDGNPSQRVVIDQVSELYGFDRTHRLGLPDAQLDEETGGSLVASVAKVFQDVRPQVIYIPNRSDAHSDHRCIYQAIAACTKPFRYPYIKEVLMMEVMSETDCIPALPETAFIPNVFVDISKQMAQKVKIMQSYQSELMNYPYIRSSDSIRALSRYRGAQINVEFAEAFMLLKSIR